MPSPSPSPSPPTARSQFGQSRDAAKRSINLALSFRGQSALAAAGLLDSVMAQTVEMPQRAIHTPDGALVRQQYGQPGQAIYSVGRQLINRAFLDELDKLANVQVYFESSLSRLEGDGALTVKLRDGSEHTYTPRLVVGADGAYSAVRNAMLRFSRTDFHRRFIDHGYKELAIPPSVTGDYALPVPNALHIWPRKKFMLIALPNPDRSFTCTLFMPFADFDRLQESPAEVRPFFEKHFPDTVPLLPALEAQFAANPTSSLVEVRVKPLAHKDRVVLVGDAAHSTVPFYGQGMNAALEDCVFFTECLDAVGGADLAAAVRKYAEERQPAGEGLCDLSMGNYDEMKDKTASMWFRVRRRLEGLLHAVLPASVGFIPQYSMVAFTRIPYHEVIRRAERQDAILDAALAGLVLLAAAAGAGVLARTSGGKGLSGWAAGVLGLGGGRRR